VIGLVCDYDNDGDNDIMMCSYEDETHQPVPLRLLTNLGNGQFQPLSSIFLQGSFPSGTWVDYDLDGDTDFFAAGANGTTDVFYKNTGNDPNEWQLNDTLSFLKFRQGFITHDSWVDLDEDGDLDLYIANYGPPGNNANTFHRSMLKESGNPDYFVETPVSGLTGENGANIGVNWVDYDNDGDLDLYLNYFQAKDRLYRNEGNLVFTQIAGLSMLNVTAYTNFNTWADFDLDGDQDLVLSHQLGGSSKAKLYRNEHIPADGMLPGSFTLLNEAAGGELNQASIANAQSGGCADYDNDGDMDLYIVNTTNQSVGAPNFLFRNDQNLNRHWLKIKLQGQVSNRNGYGAIIRVNALIAGDTVRQMRLVSGGTNSYSFQNSAVQHFGLGDADSLLSVEVYWPSGLVDVCTGLAADQLLFFSEGDCLVNAIFTAQLPKTERLIRSLSPNPGHENLLHVQIFTSREGPVRWRLLDTRGLPAAAGERRMNAGAGKFELPVQTLPAGVYFFVVETGYGYDVKPWLRH
jgi:hypothetical protein